MWINYKTEYSFGSVFGPIKKVAERAARAKFAGIADTNGTWGHVLWEKHCKALGIKPVFGVCLPVVFDTDLRERRSIVDQTLFIAMNNAGLKEIYNLVDTAHKQFYYHPRITVSQLSAVSLDVCVALSGIVFLDHVKRQSFVQLSTATPSAIKNISGIDYIAALDNSFIKAADKGTYEPFADERKTERKTTTQHIITPKQWLSLCSDNQQAIDNMQQIGEYATVTLKHAPLVKYPEEIDLEKLCRQLAPKRGVDLQDKIYAARFDREIKLIKEKGYVDMVIENVGQKEKCGLFFSGC